MTHPFLKLVNWESPELGIRFPLHVDVWNYVSLSSDVSFFHCYAYILHTVINEETGDWWIRKGGKETTYDNLHYNVAEFSE